MTIRSSIKTFLFILRRRPHRAWDLLQLRAEAKTGVSLHFVSLRRLMTRRFEVKRTQEVRPDLKPYGNYMLDPSKIREKPVVFSLGVGDDIDFDLALLEAHEAQLFLFDPTPTSARFVEAADLPANARFSSLAVADHDGEVELFIDDLQDALESTSSVSLVNRGFLGHGFKVPCRRISGLMAERGIDRLDILKFDIEGAAIAVLNDALDSGIFPTQIVGEFERPDTLADVRAYLRQLDALFGRLKTAGYEIYRTRENHQGFQVEILAVRSGADEARLARQEADSGSSPVRHKGV